MNKCNLFHRMFRCIFESDEEVLTASNTLSLSLSLSEILPFKSELHKTANTS